MQSNEFLGTVFSAAPTLCAHQLHLDDWNVKYFMSNKRGDEEEETEWNNKARSQRSDKQSWKYLECTKAERFYFVTRGSNGEQLSNCPFFVYRRYFTSSFIDLLMEQGKKNILLLLTNRRSFHVPKGTQEFKKLYFLKKMNEAVLSRCQKNVRAVKGASCTSVCEGN